MDFDPAELDALSREDLILRARARGVERPEQMTRIELRDEIVRLSEPDLERQRRTRGWLGVARDLLASVVESGLNLPDAAAAIRGDGKGLHEFQGPPPVATVTLAEIYATQGHYEQALTMLDEVITREPEHATARKLRERIAEERDLGPGRRRKVVETRAESLSTPQPPAVALKPEPAPVVIEPPAPAAAPSPAAAAEPSPVAAAAEPSPVAAAPEPSPVAAAPSPVAVPEPTRVATTPFSPPSAAVAAEPVPPVAAPPVAAPPVAAPPVAAPPVAAPPVAAPPVAPPPVEPVLAATSSTEVEPPAEVQAGLLVLQTLDRAFVYWRLPEVTDSLRLRSVTVGPSDQGPTVTEEDFSLPLPTGGFWLSRHALGAEVRAAIGAVSSTGFSPLAVARVLDSEDAAFEPPGAVADHELEAAARLAAGL